MSGSTFWIASASARSRALMRRARLHGRFCPLLLFANGVKAERLPGLAACLAAPFPKEPSRPQSEWGQDRGMSGPNGGTVWARRPCTSDRLPRGLLESLRSDRREEVYAWGPACCLPPH